MKVFLGIPCHAGGINEGTARSTFVTTEHSGRVRCMFHPTSLLPRGFNKLYATALNDGFTHFAMLHADIEVLVPYWIDRMLGLMEKTQADVLSVVSPMKNMKGLTSTAIDINPHTGEWDKWRVKRLTMKEVFDRPPTWTEEGLLINTGCMLIDLRSPIADKFYFEFIDQIIFDEDGKRKAVGMSEDWQFSRLVNSMGGKIFATREIPIAHIGPASFGNQTPWGEWNEDKE